MKLEPWCWKIGVPPVCKLSGIDAPYNDHRKGFVKIISLLLVLSSCLTIWMNVNFLTFYYFTKFTLHNIILTFPIYYSGYRLLNQEILFGLVEMPFLKEIVISNNPHLTGTVMKQFRTLTDNRVHVTQKSKRNYNGCDCIFYSQLLSWMRIFLDDENISLIERWL